jgi:hypothetical protein
MAGRRGSVGRSAASKPSEAQGHGRWRDGRGGEKRKDEPFFSLTSGVVGNFFQLHRDLELVEYPLRYSIKTMELGPAPPFFWSRSAVELLELGVFG